MTEPIITFFGPSIRTERWLRLYDCIQKAFSQPFEIILVGPNKSDFILPENFKHIGTNVKPAQCCEIGFRATKSELVMPIADDEVFAPGSIDSVYELWQKTSRDKNTDKVITSFRYKLFGEDLTSDVFSANRFDVRDPESPMAPLCPLIKRQLWADLGGIDRRFIALYWDLDLAMRVYEAGGIGVISPTATLEEFPQECKGRLYDDYGPPYDRLILDSLWTVRAIGYMSKIRLSPVQSFEDKSLLLYSQGPKGKWD